MNTTTEMTINEIRDAVDSGKTVFAGSSSYEVKKMDSGEYWIINHGMSLPLHGMVGTDYENVLNGSGFYISE